MRELRLALALVFLALPGALSIAGSRGSDRELEGFDVSDAPRDLAGLTMAGDAVLAELVFNEVEPSAYLMRSYSDGQRSAMAYVSFYTGYTSSGAHDPQVCYPAQGFDIGAIRDVPIELGNGERLWSKIFSARQSGYEEVVLHWFQPRGRWPAQPQLEPWIRMFQALRGHKAYAFVRVSVEIGAGGVAKAEEDAIAIARELAPWPRRVLSRAKAHGEPPRKPPRSGLKP